MNLGDLSEKVDDHIRSLTERRADALIERCRKIGIEPPEAELTVFWGGGKDSTLALFLSCIIASRLNCSVRAVTMVHPGLSVGTIKNIRHIVKSLDIPHEWRQFVQVCDSPISSTEPWIKLYRALARSTGLHARFMCVACNFGSLVVEYETLKASRCQFRVTGNPQRELEEFDRWSDLLYSLFSGHLSFPELTGISILDYYRTWWAVYNGLLKELNNMGKFDDGVTESPLDISDYLFELPDTTCTISNTQIFSVLEDDEAIYLPHRHNSLLTALGWRLPEDIMGGTESDCVMPAAIAAIDMHHFGYNTYLTHLDYVSKELSALPEMHDRAVSWATSGRAARVGGDLLNTMGISLGQRWSRSERRPISMALVEQLLPVR